MSRTYRRKNYRPSWVTKDSVQFEDRNTGAFFWVWRVEIEDAKERQKQINWWHMDDRRQHWYNPCKGFRKWVDTTHRVACKEELAKYMKNNDYEVMILDRPKYPWWD